MPTRVGRLRQTLLRNVRDRDDARPSVGPVVHLIRDHVGIAVVRERPPVNGYSIEIRALLAHPDITREMDPVAFWHYLTFIVIRRR